MENNVIEKKEKGSLLWLVIVLLLLLALVSGFLVYDKFFVVEDSETCEPCDSQTPEKEIVVINYSNACYEGYENDAKAFVECNLAGKLTYYLGQMAWNFEEDIFESQSKRNFLAVMFVKDFEYTKGDFQAAPLVPQKDIAKEYLKLFDEELNYFSVDSSELSGGGHFGLWNEELTEYIDCNEENFDKCYYSYNNTFQPGEYYNLIVNNVENNVVTGIIYEEELVYENGESVVKGPYERPFKITLNKTDGKYSFESFVISEK